MKLIKEAKVTTIKDEKQNDRNNRNVTADYLKAWLIFGQKLRIIIFDK